MNKKQILFSALFLTFACASAGAVPPEPSALSAFCPPSEGKAFHSEWISLGLKAADLKEKQASAGHITDVGEAQIQLHFPAGWSPQDKRTALCIFPGGGYAIQAIEKEGSRIAGWAAEHDMVGVVVKYRVSGPGNALWRFPGPLLDARQALRTVRKNASSLGIDPLRIGVMGFSAGGHLAAMASTLWNRTLSEEAENPLKNISARPDFSMFIYPVITMAPHTTHGGTRNKILGNHPSPALEEMRVTRTPVRGAIRLTLPDQTPARVAIFDREGKHLLKAVRYVSPMKINISDLEPGTYRMVVIYGPASTERLVEL